MKRINPFQCITAVLLILLLAVAFSLTSLYGQEGSAQNTDQAVFKTEELDQMLAPIALYPDALLAQILAASTYPLEVVSAARLAKANPNLKGEELLALAQDKDWEPSVKSMLGFPGVLEMMDEQLEWTTNLGDAFLAQQQDVMDSVQRLRNKAYAQGNLSTSKEQIVKVEPQTKIIIVEPASPTIVYVPVYDPFVVYGPWWYPAYPPYNYYPRRYYISRGFTFGFFTEIVWAGWGIWYWNWPSRYVYININYYNDFGRRYYRKPPPPPPRPVHHSGRIDPVWQHDPAHRKHVEYRDAPTAKRFDAPQRTAPAVIAPLTSVSETSTKIKTRPLTGTTDNRVTVKPTQKSTIKADNFTTAKPVIKNDKQQLKSAYPKSNVAKDPGTRPLNMEPKPNNVIQQKTKSNIKSESTKADFKAAVVNKPTVEVKRDTTQTIIKTNSQKTVKSSNSQTKNFENVRQVISDSIKNTVNKINSRISTTNQRVNSGLGRPSGSLGNMQPGAGMHVK